PTEDTRAFTFVVVADPHVYDDGEHTRRLEEALTWIEAQREALAVDFVLVAGDVAWKKGHDPALAAFDTLPIPWVPVIGDNEIQYGEEALYAEKFSPHLAGLADRLEDWRLSDVTVTLPETGEPATLLNWRFRHRGVTFLGLDWGTRIKLPILGENAALHDVEGGTWRFFEEELAAVPEGLDERVIVLTHHPMLVIPGGFTAVEGGRIAELTRAREDVVAMNLGGHFHLDFDQPAADAGYDVVLTDATWDDEVRVRVVDVWRTVEGAFRYDHHTVTIPFTP
ncbi:MAG: metallophosphoesterase, partial [Alphaproteobacteria bacterium]|nr:metallophosphoesterase [Alphaproteobacteria bacterium]